MMAKIVRAWNVGYLPRSQCAHRRLGAPPMVLFLSFRTVDQQEAKDCCYLTMTSPRSCTVLSDQDDRNGISDKLITNMPH